MKRFLLVLLLLTSCAPKAVESTTPIEPKPIIYADVSSGNWQGSITSSLDYYVDIQLSLTQTDNNVTGTIEFVNERIETIGDVSGIFKADANLDLNVSVTDGVEVIEFVMDGAIKENVYSGNIESFLGSPAEFNVTRDTHE